ncbi:MAG: multicopper oxidase domain-containing protein [Deltaproteobacteria bacterium]|nr:multicopper oxidase domain-containing protein [Deltaproteobacteria bacterium]
MKRRRWQVPLGMALVLLLGAMPAHAVVRFQCPANLLTDGAGPGGVRLDPATGFPTGETDDPNVLCIHLTAGDGWVTMADKVKYPNPDPVNLPAGSGGWPQYIFGFASATGIPDNDVMMAGMLADVWSAPTLKVREGQDLYLTLTNVGMILRPDLFDPHSVHYHGFPNAAPIFDGVPDASTVAVPGASFTYFYHQVGPPDGDSAGTYMWHCHVEATEHMQMGMLGNLYVLPAQDGSTVGGCASQKYVFTDGDGSTCYDVDYPLQIVGFDQNFHDKHIAVQPLPFASMKDTYSMFNGRGYPDTTLGRDAIPAPVDRDGVPLNPDPFNPDGKPSQRMSALIEATAGQKVLLRISSLSSTSFHNIEVLGIPMTVVGKDAKILRSSTGTNMFYQTNSVSLGGGQTADAILDTTGIAPGTYFIYARELGHLNNFEERFGGMMTEIRISAP